MDRIGGRDGTQEGIGLTAEGSALAIEAVGPRTLVQIGDLVASYRADDGPALSVDGKVLDRTLQRRIEHFERISEVAYFFSDPKSWGGTYIDWSTHQLVFLVADDSQISLVQELIAGEPDVEIKLVHRTELDWIGITERIGAAIGLDSPSQLVDEFDPRANVSLVARPDVGAVFLDISENLPGSEDFAARAQSVASELGVRLEVSVVRGRFTEDACNPTSCAPPLSGGVRLNGNNGNNCTYGFLFTSNGTNNHGSTAGHCGLTSFSHGGTYIGTTTWASVASDNIDAQLTTMDAATWNPQATIFTYSNEYTQVKSQATQSGMPYNSLVCGVGATTYAEVGAPLEYGFLVGKYATFFGNSSNLGKVDTCNSREGDSGGPWFQSVSGGVQAVGLHKGSGGGFCYFSFTSDVQAITGWRPKTK